ncbi:hypothetical protein [Acinetobacter ursingii]|uniref:hypothetical protein n=1 Tax=Acinetobacter ursingii TaxID=108980 RepID=UPI00124FE0C1|nr:hypothetical protein [Acinetobacter ursingii]MEC8058244.1 hypothetical protein [Pseudomonadota bacterium]
MKVINHKEISLLTSILKDASNIDYLQKTSQLLDDLHELPQLDLPIFDHFAPNVYMRQMDAPAGSLVVSKIHKTEHFNILIKGSLTIMTNDGVKHLQAPLIIKSDAGTRRVGYFHEDSSWITIHPTELTNVSEIEKEIIMSEDEMKEALSSMDNGGGLCHG